MDLPWYFLAVKNNVPSASVQANAPRTEYHRHLPNMVLALGSCRWRGLLSPKWNFEDLGPRQPGTCGLLAYGLLAHGLLAYGLLMLSSLSAFVSAEYTLIFLWG